MTDRPNSETDMSAVEAAVGALRTDGVAVLAGLIDPGLIARCLAEIEQDYPDLEAESSQQFSNARLRFTMRLPIKGALAEREIFANPVIVEIARRMLDRDCVLDSMGLLVSLPGATRQDAHKDLALFHGASIDHILPPFALSLAVPLVRTDRTIGTTAFFRGTHRRPEQHEEPDFVPCLEPGSVMLWDYRVRHFGTENLGNRPRLVLFSTIARSWFVEPYLPEPGRYEKLVVSRADRAAYDLDMKTYMARAQTHD